MPIDLREKIKYAKERTEITEKAKNKIYDKILDILKEQKGFGWSKEELAMELHKRLKDINEDIIVFWLGQMSELRYDGNIFNYGIERGLTIHTAGNLYYIE